MSDTIINLHPKCKRVRTFSACLPMHQILYTRKALDIPRGLYDPRIGRAGDAWGQNQVRFLKRYRRRRERREGKRDPRSLET